MGRYRKKFGAVGRALAAVALLLALIPAAEAAVAVLLEQPYGKLNLIDPAGHTAIYLDHVCAETQLRLRACRPGEMGVVLSRYDGIGDHDWVAMPLIPYLYAVDFMEEIPETVDRIDELRLRDVYRRRYLEALAPDRADGTAPDSNWYELVGSAFDRTIYGFKVATTSEQDAELIAIFNDGKNTERYNGMFRNCADFVRVTINRVYPHAIRRNYIADLGLTSPKSVARGLAHYAKKHPETDFEVFVVPQVKGDLPRSHLNTDLAEGILKRFSVPLVVVSPVVTGVVLAAYVGHGRFAMPKNAQPLELTALQQNYVIERPLPERMPQLPAPALRQAALVSTTTAMAAAPVNGSMLRVGLVK